MITEYFKIVEAMEENIANVRRGYGFECPFVISHGEYVMHILLEGAEITHLVEGGEECVGRFPIPTKTWLRLCKTCLEHVG